MKLSILLFLTFMVVEIGLARNLLLEKYVFNPGDEIRIQFEASSGIAGNAWIRVISSHVQHGGGSKTNNENLSSQELKMVSGTLIFRAPKDEGPYDFRMYDHKDNGHEIDSISFRVEGASFSRPALAKDLEEMTVVESTLEKLLDEERLLIDFPPQGLTPTDLTQRIADLRARIAMQYLDQADLESAYDYLSSSVELDPTQAERWEHLGDLALFIDVPNSQVAAHVAYQYAVTMDPFRRTARLKLINAFIMQQEYEKAIENYEYFFSDITGPTQWSEISRLTTLYPLANQTQRGIGYFQRLFFQEGDNRFALAMAILLNLSGRPSDAVKVLDMIAESEEPDSLLIVYAEELKKKYQK